jgi:hypothetical protein
MADGFDDAVLGQAPPCTFYEQCDPQFITCPHCGFAKHREMPTDARCFRPLRSVEDYRTREEFVPHCSESRRRALQWEQWAVVRLYVERATEGMECLPAKLGRAIDCMRLIAGRTKFAHSLALSLQ